MEKKKRNWFLRHPILSVIFLLILIGIISGIIQSAGESSSSNKEEYISLGIDSILPSDEQIPREWTIDTLTISDSPTGLTESKGFQLVQGAGTLSQTSISISVFKFNSINNSKIFYNEQIEKINIRGVDVWDLGNDCFGIDRELGLGYNAKGYCLRGNIVLKVDSTTISSWTYAEDGKDFMQTMISNLN